MPYFNKSAKERERARQKVEMEREAIKRANEEACGADGGHVWQRDGFCAGCNNYNALYNRANRD